MGVGTMPSSAEPGFGGAVQRKSSGDAGVGTRDARDLRRKTGGGGRSVAQLPRGDDAKIEYSPILSAQFNPNYTIDK